MSEDTKPKAQVIDLAEYKRNKQQIEPGAPRWSRYLDILEGEWPDLPSAVAALGREELRQPADPERLKTRPLVEHIPRANITDEQAQRFNKAMREMLRGTHPAPWYASLLKPLPEPEPPTEIAGPSLSFFITDEPKDPDPTEP